MSQLKDPVTQLIVTLVGTLIVISIKKPTTELMGLFGDFVVIRSHGLGRRVFLRMGAAWRRNLRLGFGSFKGSIGFFRVPVRGPEKAQGS